MERRKRIDRRMCSDRRSFSYAVHIPERRVSSRRKMADRRK